MSTLEKLEKLAETNTHIKRFLKEMKKNKKRHCWDDAIQTKDKESNINKMQRNFRPKLITDKKKYNKRIGINKSKTALFASADYFNEF